MSGFCRRCGNIVTGARCTCGGAPRESLSKPLLDTKPGDKWSQKYLRTSRSNTPIDPSPPSSSKILESGNFDDFHPSTEEHILGSVFGSVLSPNDKWECVACSSKFEREDVIYPHPEAKTNSELAEVYFCRACFAERFSKGDCKRCGCAVLTDAPFVLHHHDVWHQTCYTCMYCDSTEEPVLDFANQPSCESCFDNQAYKDYSMPESPTFQKSGCSTRLVPAAPRWGAGARPSTSGTDLPNFLSIGRESDIGSKHTRLWNEREKSPLAPSYDELKGKLISAGLEMPVSGSATSITETAHGYPKPLPIPPAGVQRTREHPVPIEPIKSLAPRVRRASSNATRDKLESPPVHSRFSNENTSPIPRVRTQSMFTRTSDVSPSSKPIYNPSSKWAAAKKPDFQASSLAPGVDSPRLPSIATQISNARRFSGEAPPKAIPKTSEPKSRPRPVSHQPMQYSAIKSDEETPLKKALASLRSTGEFSVDSKRSTSPTKFSRSGTSTAQLSFVVNGLPKNAPKIEPTNEPSTRNPLTPVSHVRPSSPVKTTIPVDNIKSSTKEFTHVRSPSRLSKPIQVTEPEIKPSDFRSLLRPASPSKPSQKPGIQFPRKDLISNTPKSPPKSSAQFPEKDPLENQTPKKLFGVSDTKVTPFPLAAESQLERKLESKTASSSTGAYATPKSSRSVEEKPKPRSGSPVRGIEWPPKPKEPQNKSFARLPSPVKSPFKSNVSYSAPLPASKLYPAPSKKLDAVEICSFCEKELGYGTFAQLENGEIIHQECFICSGCHKILEGKHVVENGRWHKECAPAPKRARAIVTFLSDLPEPEDDSPSSPPKYTMPEDPENCHRCTEPLYGNCVTLPKSVKAFHDHCLICQGCGETFSKSVQRGLVEIDGEIFHPNCAPAQLPTPTRSTSRPLRMSTSRSIPTPTQTASAPIVAPTRTKSFTSPSIFSTRQRPPAGLGGLLICAGCGVRATERETVLGPKGKRYHGKCLRCGICSRALDSECRISDAGLRCEACWKMETRRSKVGGILAKGSIVTTSTGLRR